MVDRLLSSTVTVQFDEGGGEDLDLVLEASSEATGLNPFEGWRAVRQFPSIGGVTRAASVGIIMDTGQTFQLTRTEFVRFEGDSGSLRYPVDQSSITTEVLFAFSERGKPLSPGQLSFSFTRDKKEFKANRPFIGAVKVRYFTRYRLLAYQPDGGIEFNVMTGDGWYRRFGTVIAVKDTASAILEMEPGEVNEFNLRKELYRIVSLAQSNDIGTWELHPTFDSGGFWPSPSGAPRQGDPLMELERPHEIGWLSRTSVGAVLYDTRTVIRELGADSNFKPALTVRFQSEADFIGTMWEDSYFRVNIDQVKDNIESRWKGYQITFAG